MLYLLFISLLLLVFCWIAFFHVRVAVPLFFALLPTYLLRFSLGPLPTTFLEMCFLILFVSWALRERGTLAHDVRSLRFWCVAGILGVVSFLSLVVVPHEHLFSSLGLWRAYIFEPALLFWMLWHVFSSEEIRIQSFLSVVLSASALSLLGIFQFVTHMGIPAPWDIEGRITSVFDYPNALGLFLAPVLSALLVFGISTWKEREHYQKIFIIGVSGILLVGIGFAKTEAALVVVPAALVLSLLLSPRPSSLQKVAGSLFAVLIFAGAFFFAPVREKLLLQDYSGLVRRSQWHETALLLHDHWFAGAGFGYYPELLRVYHTDWQYEIFQYPHTLLFNVWGELGILGVLAFGVLLVFLGRALVYRRFDALSFAAGIALLTMCIHGLVDVPFFKNDLAMLSVFFIALLLSEKNSF